MKLEDYALIGDCETAALVGLNGSIDWLCLAGFLLAGMFCGIVGDQENAMADRLQRAATQGDAKISRPYFDSRDEIVCSTCRMCVLRSSMPIRGRHSDVVRIVRCIEGRVSMEMELCVRFGYGRTVPWTGPYKGNEWAAAAGTGVAYLRTRRRCGQTTL